MNPIKKGNLLVIFLIAIIAFGTSNVVASVTDGESILNLFNMTNNETTKLVTVGEEKFVPLTINQVNIVNNTTNETNKTNKTNSTNSTIDNLTNIFMQNNVSN
ncbi:hypothetical protein [Methanobrevibacter cuticularis]|uniref:hypothetical protein n=1 Tax=Methanobrevibacter cuticularis TaxID=47311 RepID=UPI000832DE01|nr:hypothetical protein [Methanobrevibacter cuticularis]